MTRREQAARYERGAMIEEGRMNAVTIARLLAAIGDRRALLGGSFAALAASCFDGMRGFSLSAS